MVTVAASGGEYAVSVLSGQRNALEAGLFIDIDGEAYRIESVDPLLRTLTLVEVRQ